MEIGIKRESQALSVDGALEDWGREGGEGASLCLFNPHEPPLPQQHNYREKWTSEAERQWAGLRERGIQPRLKGIWRSGLVNGGN